MDLFNQCYKLSAWDRVNKQLRQQRQLKHCCRNNFHSNKTEQLELGDVDKKIRMVVDEILVTIA